MYVCNHHGLEMIFDMDHTVWSIPITKSKSKTVLQNLQRGVNQIFLFRLLFCFREDYELENTVSPILNQQNFFENLPCRFLCLIHFCCIISLMIFICIGDNPDAKVTAGRIFPRALKLHSTTDIAINCIPRIILLRFIIENICFTM